MNWVGMQGIPGKVKEDMENHRKSHIKKKRKSGFRRRMKSYGGRKVLANKRRANKHGKAKRRKVSGKK
jgi:ribosomal protein L34